MELTQVYLMVEDYDLVKTFYSEKLGLSIERESEAYIEFDTGSCTLVVEQDFDEEVLDAFGLEPPQEPRGSGSIVVLEVDDVDRTHERLVDEDVSPLTEPRNVDWGRRMFLVEDPAGYTLEISHPIEAGE